MRIRPPYNIRHAIIMLVVASAALHLTIPAANSQSRDGSAEQSEQTPISPQQIAAAQQFGQSLGIADWLGPLAPVAISPFFGIALMSGLSLYGEGWIDDGNAMLGTNSPLHNPIVFWSFLILTVVTSIPRFTKVSKPVAQAIDQVESWAGIITLVVVRLAIQSAEPEPAPVVQAGFATLGMDSLLILAAVANIFVVSSVRFFFEILIWITPIPAIDAVFEFLNKSICAVLMLLYGYSPMTALFINLGILAASLLVFRWIHRRQIYFKCMVMGAVKHMIAPAREFHATELEVFPDRPVGPLKPRARCVLTKNDDGWTLTCRRLLRKPLIVPLPDTNSPPRIERGFFTNSIVLTTECETRLSFSRRHNACLSDIGRQFMFEFDAKASVSSPAALQVELA